MRASSNSPDRQWPMHDTRRFRNRFPSLFTNGAVNWIVYTSRVKTCGFNHFERNPLNAKMCLLAAHTLITLQCHRWLEIHSEIHFSTSIGHCAGRHTIASGSLSGCNREIDGANSAGIPGQHTLMRTHANRASLVPHTQHPSSTRP